MNHFRLSVVLALIIRASRADSIKGRNSIETHGAGIPTVKSHNYATAILNYNIFFQNSSGFLLPAKSVDFHVCMHMTYVSLSSACEILGVLLALLELSDLSSQLELKLAQKRFPKTYECVKAVCLNMAQLV